MGYIYGDEFHRRIETEEGYTIILNEQTGIIEYAVLENNKLVPSGMVVGVVKPFYLEQTNFPKHLTDRKFRIAEIRQKSPEKFHNRLQKRPKKQGLKIQALEGTNKVFVVCVQFQPEDSSPTEWYSGTYSPSGFDERLFSTDSSDISMTNYYKSNSYNKFWPDGYTYPDWVTLPQTASWYKEKDSWKQIIIDALDETRNIDPTFDFTQYANNGDMDMIIVWAGTSESWGDFYWPHMSLAYVNRYGVRVKQYNAVRERNNDGSENTSISTFCHEYGHMTECPDLYDYSSFQLVPIGYYCVMGAGDRNSNFCGYLKWQVYGWVTPEEVFSSGTYNVDALGLSSASNPRLYKINIELPEEYLLLENRHNGADPDYENHSGRKSGLLITHIDENYPPNECLPDYTFYGLEALIPGLDPSITTLEEYAAYYGEMVFASDYGFSRLEPAYPDDQPAGAYLALTSGDDTENVIYRNTQGHSKSTEIYINDISSSQQTLSFSVNVPPMSPTISGSVKTPNSDGIDGVALSFSDGGGETITDANGKYVHDVSLGWSGTVTPSKTDYIFDPPNQSYSNVMSSQIDQDYFASSSFLKGRVTNNASARIEDVFVYVFSATGSYITYDLTDINGDYLVGGLTTGDYKIWFWPTIASGMYALEWYNDKDSFATADSVSVTERSTTSGIDAVLANGGNITGRVTDIFGAGIEDVLVFAYPPTGSYVAYGYTDSNGNYEVPGLKAGNYKLNFDTTYAIGDYNSEWYNDKDSIDTADSVSVEEWSITSGINAELSTSNPIIAGAVKTPEDLGIEGVIISFSEQGDAVTDSNGNYFRTVSNGWSGTVTPSKEGCTFSPSSRNYTNVTSDQLNENYIATTITTPAISGKVKASDGTGIEGVTITFSNAGGSTATDSSGNYSHSVSLGWSGSATPSKIGYSFSPASRSYSNVTSDQTSQDYTATFQTYTISGKVSTGEASSLVRMSTQEGLSGVVMYGLPVNPTTDASGNYSATVEHGWSGAVTPRKTWYSFSPPSRTYSNVTSDQPSQDYTGTAGEPSISWTSIGPYGGDIKCMAMSQTDPDIIFAGTPKGLFKTDDGCANWKRIGFSEEEVREAQVDPSNPDIVYLVTADGIFKSENGGENWAEMGLTEHSVKALAIDPNSTNVLYAGTSYYVEAAPDEKELYMGIFKSVDSGETWEEKISWKSQGERGWDYMNYILVDPDDSFYIYACGSNNDYDPEFGGFLKSMDGGETWENSKLTDRSGDPVWTLAKPPASYDAQVIYAVAGKKSESDLYKSTDRGDNWTKVECSYTYMHGDVLEVDPTDPKWVFVGTTDDEYSPIWKYNNNEQKWDYVASEGLLLKPPSYLLIHPQESHVLYAGFSNNGVFKYEKDTNSWSPANQGLSNVSIKALRIHPHSSYILFVAGTGFGYPLARTDDMGNSWDYLDGPPSPIGAISISNQDPLTILVGKEHQGSCGTWITNYYSLYKSEDGGQNWAEMKFAYCYAWCGLTKLTEILIDDYNADFILVGSTVDTMGLSFVVKTTNGGGDWDGSLDYDCNALAVDPNNHNIVYIGGKSGAVYKYTDVWEDWSTERIKIYQYEDIRNIDVDMNSKVYLATDEGLKKWDGSAWTKLSGLPTDNITSLAIDKDVYPGIIYAGTWDNGVFVSQDGGNTWTEFNKGLGNLKIRELAISKTHPKMLYAGTADNGAWRINVSSLSMRELTVEAAYGGTTDPAPGSYDYDYGTEVTITAIPDDNYRFSEWIGDVPAGCENDNPVTITMDSDKTITANFIRQYTLTVAAGNGGTTDSAPGSYTYDSGTQVSITATPDTGFRCAGWTGDVPSGCENDNPLTIIMDSNKTITANFIAQYTLTIAAGTGGTTEPEPGSYTHDSGTQVQVTASVTSSGYQFSGWSGDASGTANPITITMDRDKSITANFTPPPPEEPGDGDGGVKKGGCFIATAAYGSPIHPHLDILRDFRDKYLMPNSFGRKFVELYYRYSPTIASFIAKHKLLKVAVRINLLPLIVFSSLMVHFGPVATAVVLVFMLAFPILFIRFYPGKGRGI